MIIVEALSDTVLEVAVEAMASTSPNVTGVCTGSNGLHHEPAIALAAASSSTNATRARIEPSAIDLSSRTVTSCPGRSTVTSFESKFESALMMRGFAPTCADETRFHESMSVPAELDARKSVRAV